MLTRFSLNLYTNSLVVQFGSVIHLAHDPAAFLEEVGFDFPSTRMFDYEVERGIAIVERIGGEREIGTESPEAVWFIDNIDLIRSTAQQEADSRHQEPLAPTWDMLRSMALASTDWVVQRHNEQLLIDSPTTLSQEQFVELLKYRQMLRDLPREQAIPTPPLFV